MVPAEKKVPESDDEYFHTFLKKVRRYFCGHGVLFWFSFFATIITIIGFFGFCIDYAVPTVMVDGQVLMDGHPCPNATIHCDDCSANSNQDGTFILYVKKGTRSVYVTKDGINQTSQLLNANGPTEKMVIFIVKQSPYTD